MSDNWTKIVPVDPWLSIAPERLEVARVWFASQGSNHSETKVSIFDKPHFFDAGANFSNVSCPSCGAVVSLVRWSQWMDEDSERRGFHLKPKQLACCEGPALTLNDLKYDFYQGFGACAVEGRKLDIGVLSGADIDALESLIGTRISVIYQHI